MSNWPGVVNRLADVLRSKSLENLIPMIDRSTAIRMFASDGMVVPEKLLGVCSGCKLIGVHAYLKSPTSLASDLSDDFKSADVPDSLRHDMVIPEPDAERSANEVASKWLAQVMQPGPEQAIGVIVLWRRERADNFSSTASNRPLFILIKADQVDGRYVLRQITFGDPLERKR